MHHFAQRRCRLSHILSNLLLIAFSACGTASPSPSPSILLTVAPLSDRPFYRLNISLDYDQGLILAQERIEFVNPTNSEITAVKFNVPPARHQGAIEIRDARITGQAKSLMFTQDKTVLTVQLAEGLPAGKSISLAFNFTLRLPQQGVSWGIGGDDTARGPNSLIAGHWYIMLAPYRNGAWDTPNYFALGDSYTESLADYEVNIIAPAGVTLAGAGFVKRNDRLWQYELLQARVFAFAASKSYKVRQSEVDGVTFLHYGYSTHDVFADDVLITAERAVKLYSKLYGKYPYDKLVIVEIDRAQGQEYSGLVALGSGLYNGYSGSGSRHDLISSTAHEVAHQWWYHVVGNDQVRTPWLDEAFARMAEYRFYQTYYPQDADWWLSFYITTRNPQGAIDLPLSGYKDSPTYISAVYRRGVQFLIDLRKLMGDAAFDATMSDYYVSQSYLITSADAFFDAVARHTDRDVSLLVRNYFENPPKLPCKISVNAPDCRKLS